MLPDIENMYRMVGLLGDDGFVDALSETEQLVEDATETLDRVEQIEREAQAAVQEATETLHAVDHRLMRFDETLSLLEAKIEAGFSVGFLFFAVNTWLAGNQLLAAGLFVMGLLGASSLVVTVLTLPQVRRLREAGEYASDRIDRRLDRDARGEEPSRRSDTDRRGERGSTE